jgi:hypothetical protein
MTKEKYRLIIIVKHGLMEPWLEILRNGQCKTWLTLDIPATDIKIIHFYGMSGGKIVQSLNKFHEKLRWSEDFSTLVHLIDKILFFPILLWIPKVVKSNLFLTSQSELQCRVIDTTATLRWKQLAVYHFVKNNYEFDFLYETNTSSYIIPRKILELIDEESDGIVYAGNLGYPGANFVSGANRLLSAKALNLLIKKRRLWNTALLEDVAIGNLFRKLGILIQELPSLSLTNKSEVMNLSKEKIEENYHFRLKSYERDRRIDSELMNLLHDRYMSY